MTTPLYGVSTFTTDFARGNPAAVVLLAADSSPEESWYSRVAALTAQPATAFCRPADSGFALRWFSPTHELALCGHGTLATAHVLYETGAVGPAESAVLSTQGGDLRVRREGDLCWLTLPAVPLADEPVPAEVLAGLGLPGARAFARSADDLVVELEDAEAVKRVRPDFTLLARLNTTRTVVTAAGGEGVDFTSRVFPPRIGIDEDQVTGSAHAALAPYWAKRLGRVRLTARQASARGGELVLDVGVEGAVQVGGRALTTVRAELLV